MKSHLLKQNSQVTSALHLLIASTPPTYQSASHSLFSTLWLSWIMELKKSLSTALKLPSEECMKKSVS